MQYGIISAFRSFNPVFNIADNVAFDKDFISGEARLGKERILAIISASADLVSMGKGGFKAVVTFGVGNSSAFLQDNDLIEKEGLIDKGLNITTKVLKLDLEVVKAIKDLLKDGKELGKEDKK